MSSEYVSSGSIDIKKLEIVSYDGSKQYNLMSQVMTFSIFEDTMFPVIRAEFYMNDAIDLQTSFPIIGEEIINVEFSTAGYDLVNSYKLYVKSVENQAVAPGTKGKTYLIRAVSEEFIYNSIILINKKVQDDSFKIVRNIMKEILKTDKNVNIEETKGVQELLITQTKPFQAIDMIRKRSVSKKYASSSYLFFENKRGFNFCTIEYLFDNLKGNVNDKIFFYDSATDTDAKNMNSRNIIGMRNISSVNNVKKLATGSLNNIVKRFDLLTGGVFDTNYVNSEQQSKFKAPNENPIGLNTTHYEQKFGKYNATTMLVPHSSHLPENFIAESIGAKHSFAAKIAQNIYHIHVYGDSALTAGDIITIKVPKVTGAVENKDDRLVAGNYMISKLRHIVVNSTSQRKTYTCSMEVIKGSYEDNA